VIRSRAGWAWVARLANLLYGQPKTKIGCSHMGLGERIVYMHKLAKLWGSEGMLPPKISEN